MKKELINYLTPEEKRQFLDALSIAIAESKKTGGIDAVMECIDDWEDIAELNSIPGLKQGVWAKFNMLKKNGAIV